MTIPKIHNIEHISFPQPEKITLSNGIIGFGFNDNKIDILRIDLVFDSGRWTESAPLVAETVAKLFKSGTSLLSSFQLNEKIDFYGTTIKASAGYNTFNVQLFCMNRFLEPSLELLMNCLNEIAFPENEIELFKKNSISKLKVNLEKNDFIADETFKKTIFGEQHPYGYATTEDLILKIEQNFLIDFYKKELTTDSCTVFMAGNYQKNELDLLDKYIGNWRTENKHKSVLNFPTTNATFNSRNLHITKEKSVQASIVIGKKSIQKNHADYASFVLLNTILGGYFGSRLMSNIREDKGLTYGIHSSLSTLKYDAVFSIHTDTNIEKKEECLHEIYIELERLCNDVLPNKEITLARNYLLGKFLTRTDGAFNQIDVFKSYYIENVNISKFEEFVETIRRTDALSLQQLAQTYFLKDSLLEVVVG